MLGALLLQIILIFMNAIFACAEIAVLSVSDTKLQKMSEDGNKKAKKLLSLTKNSSKFLSTIQVAITFAGFLGSAYAADNFAGPLVSVLVCAGITIPVDVLNSICVLVITVVLSFFSIVFGELVPKRVAMKNPERISLALVGILKFVSMIFAPFVWILTVSTNATLRLFGVDPSDQEEAATEEEIIMMLDTSSEMGAIDEQENEMIQNIFRFDDISASEACTHRKDVTFLYAEDSLDDWRTTISETNFMYYPVCGESSDDILGILSIRKFFSGDFRDVSDVIETAIDKPFYVPANTKADVLFERMKKEKNYFAVVVDEYGGTTGVITSTDLIALIVGDIGKSEDEDEEIRLLSENKWQILGSALLDDVANALDIEFDTDEFDTFGGYIFGLVGSVPEDGSKFELETDDLKINVVSVEDHRILKVIVDKKVKDLIEQ